jgi:hypothetical protein
MTRIPVSTGIAALLFCTAAAAQVAAPDDWRKETFKFPLQFAPSIPYEGTEYVRFAPFWSQFASGRGFTYVFLWDIKRRTLQPQEIERGLNVYFDGLMESVTKGRKLVDPGTVSSVALHPTAAVPGWPEVYGGRLWTWNGFSKGEALVLHLEVAMRPCEPDRTQIFFAFSQADRNHEVWEQLRSIRKATAC